ncbi:hypothetical protein MRB53_013938 [Persea americana]|uniref:Uncharacterized protein n=1 Tax=Persea americana TaxID=3435 RepID=A0ACC2K9T9_PERAE|nr:hypothetical protein MRB53_013938 [Persea americana]
MILTQYKLVCHRNNWGVNQICCCNHTGAYLMSLSDALMWGMTEGAVYLTVMVGVSLGQLQLFVGQTFASDMCTCQ